eukprot:10762336-Alexandrium_andersonii.AAC.1
MAQPQVQLVCRLSISLAPFRPQRIQQHTARGITPRSRQRRPCGHLDGSSGVAALQQGSGRGPVRWHEGNRLHALSAVRNMLRIFHRASGTS